MIDRELMQQALDALEIFAYKAEHRRTDEENNNGDKAIKAFRARLAQPEPEPVAWWHDRGDVVDLNVSGHGTPLYFAPPQREWQGLTDEECLQNPYCAGENDDEVIRLARAIEAKLKEKNEKF